MGERQDKKDRTRRSLADAAVQLFTARGYDNVTMAEVAAAADVSRRTAFRYFPSKEALVMEYPTTWLRVFDESIQAHRNLSLDQRIRTAAHDVATYIESDPHAVRQLFSLAFSHPALVAHYGASTQHWVARVADEIEQELPPSPESVAHARLLAAAIMGIINCVCELWATGDQSMRPLLDRGLDLVAEPLHAIASEQPVRPQA